MDSLVLVLLLYSLAASRFWLLASQIAVELFGLEVAPCFKACPRGVIRKPARGNGLLKSLLKTGQSVGKGYCYFPLYLLGYLVLNRHKEPVSKLAGTLPHCSHILHTSLHMPEQAQIGVNFINNILISILV